MEGEFASLEMPLSSVKSYVVQAFDGLRREEEVWL